MDTFRPAGGAPAQPLAREQVAALLAGIESSAALDTLDECDEMAVGSDQITHDESELLQSESLAARALDQDLADGLRRRRLGGETSSAGYLRDVSDRARLPAGVERRLIDAAQAGDRRAREELVEAFLPLIAGVARVYRGSQTITRLELMQEGVVGLLRALERYDPALGVPFWGYAAWWVRQAMQQLIAELTRPLVLSDRALRQLSQLKRAHGEYLVEHGREPSGNELADRTGLSHAQVADMLALERVPQSMDEAVQGAEGDVGAFGELLADPARRRRLRAAARLLRDRADPRAAGQPQRSRADGPARPSRPGRAGGVAARHRGADRAVRRTGAADRAARVGQASRRRHPRRTRLTARLRAARVDGRGGRAY